MISNNEKALTVYRIGDGRFPLFDGRGAMFYGGRWNSPGQPAIYASLSQAGAMLELMVHASIGKLPRHTQMVVIEIPAGLKVEAVDAGILTGWDHPNCQVSQRYGGDWLAEGHSVALIVPSVVAPYDRNIVINPMHTEFPKLTVSAPESVQWDARLFNRSGQG